MVVASVLLVVGLALLVAGAEALVKGASDLASRWGVSPLVIGLTVVAFGTSAPELAVGLTGALTGEAGVSVGAVVGSNVFNVLVILGASALVAPLAVASRIVRFEAPGLLFVSLLVVALAVDGALGRVDGGVLFAGLVVWLVVLLRQGRRETTTEPAAADAAVAEETGPPPASARRAALVAAAGLAGLLVGGRLLVTGAVTIARGLGVAEVVIGLTVVAAGTSLPELAASLAAARRGQRDLAVGNVVGSNLFNLLGVLGLSALVAPSPLAVARSVLSFDLVVACAAAAACLPVFFSGGRVSRGEGAMLLAWYVAYVLMTLAAATGHEGLHDLKGALLVFGLPLTGVALAAIVAAELRQRRRAERSGSVPRR